MNDSKLGDWLQILASLGVLIGLLMVAFEIRESNRVATSESVAEMNYAWIEIQLVGAESDLFKILAKSYEDPYSLSNEEMMRLESWFESILSHYEWWLRAYQLGTGELDPISGFSETVEYYFGSPFGRAYYEYARTWLAPELVAAGDAGLEGKPLIFERPSITFIREKMQEQLDSQEQD